MNLTDLYHARTAESFLWSQIEATICPRTDAFSLSETKYQVL
jgi:hypothetical protein